MSEGATTEQARPKVLYVMGAGHSGSTILGVALGNCDGLFFAGEVEEWLVKAGRPSWADGPRRDFWADVAAQVDDRGLFGTRAARSIERSSSLLRIARLRERRRLRESYRAVAGELLGAIARVSGDGCVVDTSHFPLRARELARVGAIDLYVVFLVRDARAVVESNLRELRPHEVAERRVRTLAMNVNLALTMAVSAFVFLRRPRNRRLFVRHEQFLEDPRRTLAAILRMIGSEAPLPDLSALRIGAPIEGNRLIRGETIALHAGEARTHDGPPSTTLLEKLWRPLLRRMRPGVDDAAVPGVG